MKCSKTYGLEVLQLVELIALTIVFRMMTQPKEEWQEFLILALTAVLVNAIHT